MAHERRRDREAFRAVGGFSPLLFFAGEEQLLAYDLAAGGWVLSYVPDVVAVHCPATRRPPSRWRRSMEQRHAVITTWLSRPLSTAVAESAGLARRASNDPAALRALGGVLVRLPLALAGRHVLPAPVEAGARHSMQPAVSHRDNRKVQ